MPVSDLFSVVLVVAALAGGAAGAALGALRAFAAAGALVAVTELWGFLAGSSLLAPAPVPGGVPFGPLLGPYVAFAGGIAAAAYAVRKGHLGPGEEYPYHPAKRVATVLGPRPRVLAVGAVFGLGTYLLAAVSGVVGLPWDPVTMAVVLSVFGHRVAFGYPLVGAIGADPLDMQPFERAEHRPPRDPDDAGEQSRAADAAAGETPAADGGTTRYVVEPWLPHQFHWPHVAALGVVVGVVGAAITYVTASTFLPFGLSAATLLYVEDDVPQLPVTHHITLPAGTAVAAVAAGPQATPAALAAVVPLWLALGLGAVFGLVGALAAELSQRLLYAHADTHFDPAAASVVLTTLLVAVLAIAGVLPDAAWVPTP